MNGLQSVNEDIDSALKIYQSDSERNGDFWDQTLLSKNFWLKGVLGDGMSFTAGAILSAYALGGVGSLVSKGMRLGEAAAFLGDNAANLAGKGVGAIGKNSESMTKAANILKSATATIDGASDAALLSNAAKYGQISNGVNKFGNTIFKLASGSGYESGIEALGFIKEAKTNKQNELMQKYGSLDTPEKQVSYEAEMQQFDKDIETSANSVFLVNMAIVGASNALTLPTIFGFGVKNSFKGARSFLKASETGAKGAFEYVEKQGIKGAFGAATHLVKPAIAEGL
jgi:hypothetical protein